MKSPLRVLAGALVAVLLVVVCLALYVLFGNLSVHKDRVLAAASDATGFYIGSQGPFNLDVGREVSLSVDNVIIGNPAYPDEHPLASIGSLKIVVDTWSLFSGPIEIDLVAVNGAVVNLKQASDGSANWVPASAPSEGSSAGETQEPILHNIRLDDVAIRFESSGLMRFVADDILLRVARDTATDYQLAIATNFGTSLPDKRVIAKGSVQFGPSLDDIRNVRVVLDDANFGQSGDTELDAMLSGRFAADLAADRPSYDVNINVRNLIARSIDGKEQPQAESEELLFPTTPLDYSSLQDFNLQANLAIIVAVIDGEILRDVRVATRIEDGALRVDPVELEIGNGKLTGALQLEPSDVGYALNLSAAADAIQLQQLAAENQDRDSVPPLSIDLQLAGGGQSLHDIMASSSGRVTGRQGQGQLDLQSAGALFADFLTSIVRTLNPLAEERTYTDIECGILEIDIESGIATIEELAMQSDRLTIVSSGKIDFSTEEIDLALNTKSREGLGLSVGGVANSFVKVSGTLREPAIGVDAAGTVTTTGAAVATGGLSVLAKGLWDRLSSEVDLCSIEDRRSD